MSVVDMVDVWVYDVQKIRQGSGVKMRFIFRNSFAGAYYLCVRNI